MQRPLMQHGVGQLEALFKASKADQKVLKQLEHELQYRQVPRALALLERVQSAMLPVAETNVGGQAPTSAQVPAPVPDTRQPDLWQRPPAETTSLPQPTPQNMPPAPAMPPSRIRLRDEVAPAPSIALEDACKLLKVSLASPWLEVELARRQLVQQSHPERVATLTVERRGQVLAEAKRVNAAYAALSAAKAG